MSECRREDSNRFLTGLLDPLEESAFTEHLEECPRCRRWLEEFAGSEAEWRSARELLACTGAQVDSEAAPRQSVAGLLAPPLSAAAETLTLSRLAFLAPTDDPAMVGRVGPYEISALLGRGATGIVLKGFDRALNRNVAIKVLDPAIASVGAARQRFDREARAMAAIVHEHVVPVYGVGEHAGLPYFVMEYVAGGALDRRLASHGSFDVVSVVRIGLQTAQALAAAHAQGLVHRDIKPGNILIDQGTERVRVADFGLARVASDVSCTRSGLLVGTPQFMAPEQVRGDPCDPRSDLFSLGGVMYVLCTGHVPFRAESVYGVLQRIMHDTPRSIREQNPQIPLWLEKFIFRLLAKDRGQRFTSAEEVVQLLQEELACLQSPVVVAEPARHWIRQADGGQSPAGTRRRRLAVGLIALGVFVTAGVFWRTSGGRPAIDAVAQSGDDSSQQPAEEVSGVSPSAATFLPVPLWNSDNLRAAQDLANSLESNWLSPTAAAGGDIWAQKVAEIRSRFADLSRDLEVPPPTAEPPTPDTSSP
jgi:serine/threonine-protein kinase